MELAATVLLWTVSVAIWLRLVAVILKIIDDAIGW